MLFWSPPLAQEKHFVCYVLLWAGELTSYSSRGATCPGKWEKGWERGRKLGGEREVGRQRMTCGILEEVVRLCCVFACKTTSFPWMVPSACTTFELMGNCACAEGRSLGMRL